MEHQISRDLERSPGLVAEILTTREVARELRCSKAHIHNIINGKVHGTPALPTIALGRRRLVRRASLNEWLRANEHSLG
jgi:excisionase family DNA binding protein